MKTWWCSLVFALSVATAPSLPAYAQFAPPLPVATEPPPPGPDPTARINAPVWSRCFGLD